MNVDNTYNFPIPNLTKQLDSGSSIPTGRSNTNMKILQRYWDYESDNIVDNIPLELDVINDNFNLYVSPYESYTYKYFPYAGNVNNPYNILFDLNFDVPLFFYYKINSFININNNLYNTFYKNQFEEILDVNSKIVTAQLYLTPQDIRDFRFSDVIYLRLGSSGQYYHVNKINNYSLTEPYKTTEVELIKIKEIASYPLPVADGLQSDNKLVMTNLSFGSGGTTQSTFSLVFNEPVLTKLVVNCKVITIDSYTPGYLFNITFYPGEQTKYFLTNIPNPAVEPVIGYSILSISPDKDGVYNYTF